MKMSKINIFSMPQKVSNLNENEGKSSRERKKVIIEIKLNDS